MSNDMMKIRKAKQQYKQIPVPEDGRRALLKQLEKAKSNKKKLVYKRMGIKMGAGLAAAMAILLILPNVNADIAYAMEQVPFLKDVVQAVTFRHYEVEQDRSTAEVDIPRLIVEDDEEQSDTLKKTTEEINAQIQQLTDQYIKEFEAAIVDNMGYSNLTIQHETIETTEEYFTLKLIVFQAAGSGFEQEFYYTIDLNTGEKIQLSDLFQEGADYRTVISDNIKEQMRSQMAEDESILYWVDYSDVPEWNFEKIASDQSFYINAQGNLIITFQEGDVAPMYMGCVQFEIPEDAIADMRKE